MVAALPPPIQLLTVFTKSLQSLYYCFHALGQSFQKPQKRLQTFWQHFLAFNKRLIFCCQTCRNVKKHSYKFGKVCQAIAKQFLQTLATFFYNIATLPKLVETHLTSQYACLISKISILTSNYVTPKINIK